MPNYFKGVVQKVFLLHWGLKWLPCKLKQFNRPKAKIRFKSDSNRLLINFFDPIPAVRFNRRDDWNLDHLYCKLTEIDQK